MIVSFWLLNINKNIANELEMNHNTHVEPMVIIDSELAEYEHSQNADRRKKNYSKETELWFINRDHTPFRDNFDNDEIDLGQDKEL